MIIWPAFQSRLVKSFPDNGELVYTVTHNLFKSKGWNTLSGANTHSESCYRTSTPRHGLNITDIYVSPSEALRSTQFCTPAHKTLADFRNSSIVRRENHKSDLDLLGQIFNQGRFGTPVLRGFEEQYRHALRALPVELVEILIANLMEILLSHAWFTLIGEQNPETFAAIEFLKEGTPLITLEAGYPTFRGEIFAKSRPELKETEPRS